MAWRPVPLSAEWAAALSEALTRLEGAGSEPGLFLEEREDLSILVGSRGHRIVPTCLRGLSIRTGPGPYRYRHVSDPAPAEAVELADRRESPLLRRGASGERGRVFGATYAPPEPILEQLEALIAAARAAAGAEAAVITALYVGFDQHVAVARSGRGIATDRRRGARLRLDVRLAAGGRRGDAVGERRVEEGGIRDPRRLAERTVERARERRMAGPAPSGRVPGVFAPGVGGILFHELVGHALEGDVPADGSVLPPARPELRVVDDPRRGRAARTIDDEGEPARATPLIDGGKVVGRLHDLRSARESKAEPTGHGRRAAYREPVLPRTGCTFLVAGDLEPEEVLEGLPEGVYVRRIEGAVAHTVSGTATFRVTDADRIVRGRLAGPCEPFLVQVTAEDLLRGLHRIGNDLELDTCLGSCVRDGQPLVVSVGAPTICLPVTTLLP